jgi:hypothetical protein
MPFDSIKNVPTQQKRGRITQQDLIPKAVKLRNSDIYSLTAATVLIKDIYGNTAITISQSETVGKVEFGDDAWINYINGSASFTTAAVTTLNVTTVNATTITGLYTASEMWMAPLMPQWDNSWTNLNSYADVTGSIFDVHWEDFATGWNVYFDMVGKTDAGTGYFQIYNTSDSAAITGSEVSTTSTNPVDLRSGALTIPTAVKTCKLQHKIVGGDGATEYVNSIMAKIVVRLA